MRGIELCSWRRTYGCMPGPHADGCACLVCFRTSDDAPRALREWLRGKDELDDSGEGATCRNGSHAGTEGDR
jgi:hypothetical protein